MQKLSFIIGLIMFALTGFAQSPHGDGFKSDCTVCHTSQSWKVTKADMSFDHKSTQFKLTGQHEFVDCKLCHQTLKFQEAKSECKDCHTDMHGNTLGPDCARCHDTKVWIIKNTSTMHQLSRFPLLGNHAVVDCASCHKSSSNLQFEPLGVECVDCHKKEYLAAKSPDHQKSGYSTNCLECHGVKSAGWNGASFEHGFFPLTGGHSINCAECHTDGSYQKISNECVLCHQKDFNSTTNPNHQQTGFSTSCSECHTTNPGWNPANYKQHDASFFPIYSGNHKGEWDKCTDCHTSNTYTAFSCTNCHEHGQSNSDNQHKGINGYSFQSVSCYSCHPQGDKSGAFNHSLTNFPLTGAHITTECASCHTTGYAGTSTECKSCHQAKYTSAQIPNHTTAGIPVDCKTCHTATAWQPSSFNHSTTIFPLTGAHTAIVQCSDCHKGSTTTASPECVSCHQVQYNNAKGHVASKFPTDCKLCHNSNNWLGATFNHSLTNFPLTGAHITTECASCHTTGYAGTSMECKSCHQTNFNNTQIPNHTTAGIPVDCKTCHAATAWQPSSFNHSTTIFPLTGAHIAIVQCSDCHKGSTTTAKPECISCHQVQYNSAKDHMASKFPTDCKLCHNSNNWLGATFNHSLTNFPLTGAHTTTDCALCHTMGYVGTSIECKSCHQAKYTSAQIPNHTAAGIPVDCKTCHTTTAWQPSSFQHSTTGFTLTGGHVAIVQCSACHLGSTTTAKPECISCHQVQYYNAKGHVASKFPTDCKLCHNSNNWLGATFNHSLTNFPLTGAHTTTDCALCHTMGYVGTSTECKSCHQAKYTSAQIPNHTAAGIPVDCKTCHTATAWQPSSFQHSTTGFTLTGGHAAIVQCSACHLGSTTTAKPECVSCHQVQYNNAKGHVASNFPTDCKLCHSSNNWIQTTFNHNTSNFPLTGAHVAATCISCHSTGYVDTSTECKTCHQTNFNTAATPNHITAGIPVDCKTCHTTTAWQPSTFKHSTTVFPLTGAHAAIVQCSDCHLGSTTTAKPECISCHQVQYNSAKDHVASKFPTDCKICHNLNNWLGVTFNHSTTSFPLTGAHVTATCVSCHSTGYVGTSTECNSCHLTNYNSTINPNHKTLVLFVTCKDCHSTTSWQPASFPVHSNYYALTGAHAAIATNCAVCHNGVYTTTQRTCYTCHTTDYNNTTNPAHKTAQYSTDCTSCHTVNAWVPSTFNHTSYFPISSGRHKLSCTICHTTPTNYAVFTCVTASCHGNAHNRNQGSAGCYRCHPTGRGD